MKNPKDQISRLYTNKNLIDLIHAQIEQLLYPVQIKLIRKYLALTFSVPSITEDYNFNVHPNRIQFMFVLSKGYPCTAPRLHIKTSIITPGFDDCRNLLFQVLNTQQWSHYNNLKQIQLKIPKFLQKIFKAESTVYQIARIGQFMLNMVYPIQLIREIRNNVEIYFAFQYDIDNSLKMYILDISATHLVLYLTKQQPSIQKGSVKIPSEKEVTSCMISFVAQLGSLTQIAVNRSNFNDIQLKFTCKKPQNMHLSTTSTTKKLKIRKGTQIIKKLTQNINFYKLIDINLHPIPQTIKPDQKQLLSKISIAQKVLQHKFNVATIQDLNQCYQNLVQYYSSNNIPYYQIYVQKIAILFQRPDVQFIMASYQNQDQIKEQVNI